jgi:hypothetical protein
VEVENTQGREGLYQGSTSKAVMYVFCNEVWIFNSTIISPLLRRNKWCWPSRFIYGRWSHHVTCRCLILLTHHEQHQACWLLSGTWSLQSLGPTNWHETSCLSRPLTKARLSWSTTYTAAFLIVIQSFCRNSMIFCLAWWLKALSVDLLLNKWKA